MGHPDFRVGGKIFATLGYPDAAWGTLGLTRDQQEFFVGGHYINAHAIYIAVTGIGLLCSLGVNVSLGKRITALEGTLSRMNGEKPPR